MEGANMLEFTVISLQKTMPLAERISEANRQISEWIKSLEEPFNDDEDDIQLKEYEQKDGKHVYHYIIARNIKTPRKKK
jgi:hypothetical protein